MWNSTRGIAGAIRCWTNQSVSCPPMILHKKQIVQVLVDNRYHDLLLNIQSLTHSPSALGQKTLQLKLLRHQRQREQKQVWTNGYAQSLAWSTECVRSYSNFMCFFWCWCSLCSQGGSERRTRSIFGVSDSASAMLSILDLEQLVPGTQGNPFLSFSLLMCILIRNNQPKVNAEESFLEHWLCVTRGHVPHK